jgi:hypothetical protein
MEIILIGLALIAVIVFVIPLAVLRAGIRRQEHTGCLACQPHGLSANLTRHVVGLYVREPLPGECLAARGRQCDDELSFVPDDDESPAR